MVRCTNRYASMTEPAPARATFLHRYRHAMSGMVDGTPWTLLVAHFRGCLGTPLCLIQRSGYGTISVAYSVRDSPGFRIDCMTIPFHGGYPVYLLCRCLCPIPRPATRHFH